MKTIIDLLTTVVLTTIMSCAFAQGVGISPAGGPPDPSAGLDVDFTDRGWLMPRLTEAQRNAIANPAMGLQVFNVDTKCVNIFDGSTWRQSCYDCTFASPVVSNNGPLCEGGSLQLTASAIVGATYSWTGPNGFSSSDQNPLINGVTTADAGSYELTATLNGCSSTPVATVVSVNAIPSAPTATNDGPVCSGGNVNLTASTIAGAAYSWTGPNGFTSNDQNPTVTNVTGGGVYEVTATLNGCTSTAGSTTVSVQGSGGTQTFSYSGAIASFTVPQCVTTLTVEAWGAQGGAVAGGLGAYIKGDFSVSAGELIKVVVGEKGQGPSTVWGAGGGGGGSFVWRDASPALPMVAAGAGGGGKSTASCEVGIDGAITEAGTAGNFSGAAGGTNGNGGSGNAATGAAGGAGWNTDGQNSTANSSIQGGKSKFSFLGGSGHSSATSNYGGFGGGGGAYCGGGGGGGYSGGGGGQGSTCCSGGGGGGSYNGGTNQTNTGGVRTGNGQVILSW